MVTLYLECIGASQLQLVDGADQRPHYSVRSLSRALDYCRSHFQVHSSKNIYSGVVVAVSKLMIFPK